LEREEIYRHPIVQELLNSLPNPIEDSYWNMTFPIAKKFEESNRWIIVGYASVDVIDSQDELIPIPVIKEAWENFRKNKDFYFGSLMHSNIPIIKVLDEYIDEAGQVWKSGVDENGLFIVAEVRKDIQKGPQTWKLINDGVLTGFSIGGEALASKRVCEGTCFTRIERMELHEIAVVDRPANQPSIFKIIKRAVKKEKVKIIKIEFDIEKLDTILKRMIGKPFAGYKDFAECERENQDKNDPAAYCATIQRETEKLDDLEKDFAKCGCPVNITINKPLIDKLDKGLSLLSVRK